MRSAAVDDWTLNFSASYLPFIYSMNVFIQCRGACSCHYPKCQNEIWLCKEMTVISQSK